MVRVFIKGGVWKNSEDEILKAAVMKYGKQQWARVASLLNRKSAKQCKARWNEWLDPMVKKVEWSRQEDEKLLHLAKLMPAQWRTIGPLVGGRTAVQCQERYETLLDQAANAGGEGEEEGTSAAGSSTRKLRPGEIDPHPETKPARPDPIDMDEDEIEMLQEARARLANTQGKKAKRKQRERLLEEAKRLADLQKRRELKQAGLLSGAARTKIRKKQRREIDLGVEIPFHKPAPAGFHATESEDSKAEDVRNRRLKEVDFKRVNETQKRSRDREERAQQAKEEARLRNLERSNMQYVVAQVSKKNDPLAQRPRGTLVMPAPTIADSEHAQIAKLTAAQQQQQQLPSTGNNEATNALLGDYSDRPLPTPMRTSTPATLVSKQESILRQASNLRMLERGETPLLGGEAPALLESAHAATPLPSSLANQTPLTMATTNASVPRDALGLNTPLNYARSDDSVLHPGMEGDDAASVSASSFALSSVGGGGGARSIKELAREERRAAKRARQELEAALAALPAPQFEYELAAPDAIAEEEEDNENNGPSSRRSMEMDTADVEAQELQRLREEAAKLYEARSSVLKKPDLPRPVGAIAPLAVLGSAPTTAHDGSFLAEADQLIREELLALLQHDAHAHPVMAPEEASSSKKKKKSKKRKKTSEPEVSLPEARPLDPVDETLLDQAKEMLEAETQLVWKEAQDIMSSDQGQYVSDSKELKQTLAAVNAKISIHTAGVELLYQADKGWKESIDPKKKGELAVMTTLKAELNAIMEATAGLQKKADKLEQKLTLKHGGYVKRAASLQTSLAETFEQLQHASLEQHVYHMLRRYETQGMTSRTLQLEADVAALQTDEATLQKMYGNQLHEKNRLNLLLTKK